MRYVTLLMATLVLLAQEATGQAPVTKIIIVRHADRLGNTDDLSPAGLIRAQELKRVLGLANIDSIFSTDFIRTNKTAKPLAVSRHLPIIRYDHAAPGPLIKRIVQNSAGKRVLVVGHSDTVAGLIQSCGCTVPPGISPLPDQEFDNLFTVQVQKIPGVVNLKCEVMQLKYGAVTN